MTVTGMCVTEAVNEYLDTLSLDMLGQARAEIAVSLATALDLAHVSETGVVVQTIPALSKELRATLEEIAKTQTGSDPLIEGIFQKVKGNVG